MKKLINEIAGIAESSIPYTNAVVDRIFKSLKYFLDNAFDEDYLESVEAFRREGYLPSPDYNKDFKLPYRYLAPFITDEDFEDFPVVQINMELSFRYVIAESPGDKNFSVSGGAWPVFVSRLGKDSIYGYRVKPELFPVSRKRAESVNRALVASIDFDITVYEGFDPNDIKDLEREIRAVTFHEMMHVYEAYKNKSLDMHTMKVGSSKRRSRVDTPKAHLGDTKMVGVPTEIKDAIQAILYLYYVSLPTEVKAITHEMYPYVMSTELKDFFNDTYQGRLIKGLKDFDKDSFYDVLREEANKYFERVGQEPTEIRINNFFEVVRRNLIAKYIKSSNENHSVIDTKFINKKTLKDLIDYMNIQIKNAAERLTKNVGRLYSLKADRNS